MGNSLGSKKTTKVTKINGETFKLKTPVRAEEVVKDYPGYVLLESEAVKHFGIRAKPLQPHQNLVPKRLYFLVELPNPPKEHAPRRVRSGIQISAKDRLESLMLSRRSVSDLSIMKPISGMNKEENGAVRIKLKLPRAEIEKLMKESKNEAEAAKKIMDLCKLNAGNGTHGGKNCSLLQQQVHWNGGNGRVFEGLKGREKRVSFMGTNEGGSEIVVSS